MYVQIWEVMKLKNKADSRLFLTVILYVFIAWIGNRLGNSIYMAYENSSNVLDIFINSMDEFQLIKDPMPDFNMGAIIGMVIVPVLFFCFYEYYQYSRKNYRQKEEHGSARYGEFKDIEWMKDKREEHEKGK